MASGRDGLSFWEADHRSTWASGMGSNVKWIDVGSFLGRPRPLFSVLVIDRPIILPHGILSEPSKRCTTPPRSNHPEPVKEAPMAPRDV